MQLLIFFSISSTTVSLNNQQRQWQQLTGSQVMPLHSILPLLPPQFLLPLPQTTFLTHPTTAAASTALISPNILQQHYQQQQFQFVQQKLPIEVNPAIYGVEEAPDFDEHGGLVHLSRRYSNGLTNQLRRVDWNSVYPQNQLIFSTMSPYDGGGASSLMTYVNEQTVDGDIKYSKYYFSSSSSSC